MTRRSALAPARWPAATGRRLRCAQRPLPSMMMATYRHWRRPPRLGGARSPCVGARLRRYGALRAPRSRAAQGVCCRRVGAWRWRSDIGEAGSARGAPARASDLEDLGFFGFSSSSTLCVCSSVSFCSCSSARCSASSPTSPSWTSSLRSFMQSRRMLRTATLPSSASRWTSFTSSRAALLGERGDGQADDVCRRCWG